MSRRSPIAALAFAAALVGGCSSSGSNATNEGVELLRVEVVGERPHDRAAFTEGLELDGDALYESTGMYGSSDIRVVDAATGAVRRKVALSPQFFGEGLARVGDQLVQLTWKERTAIAYRASDLTEISRFTYDGEGWGLCDDGTRLVMSNGSDTLTFRDRSTFAAQGTVRVTESGRPVSQLNELECVDDSVYANVWQTDTIVRIDAGSGRVTAVIDAAGLLPTRDRSGTEDVLNGIAYDSPRGTFLLTGKRWPSLFEVRFVAKG
ncbi:MAG TPA: glutaminyl-peptide cyclotransferase [Acidimicrobiales bacterium]|nr:glutaminyl-peptide cyclotransferase [Acidimicrobiales bacterium]